MIKEEEEEGDEGEMISRCISTMALGGDDRLAMHVVMKREQCCQQIKE